MEGTFFSAGPEAFSQTDLSVGPEASLNKYKATSKLKLELSIKEIFHAILQVR